MTYRIRFLLCFHPSGPMFYDLCCRIYSILSQYFIHSPLPPPRTSIMVCCPMYGLACLVWSKPLPGAKLSDYKLPRGLTWVSVRRCDSLSDRYERHCPCTELYISMGSTIRLTVIMVQIAHSLILGYLRCNERTVVIIKKQTFNIFTL